MDIDHAINQLLGEIGPGTMPATAYDTAWVARLCAIEDPLGWHALEWLRENQLPDGTWGACHIYYQHDRFISSLAAITALARWGNGSDRRRIEKCLPALEAIVHRLPADPVGETVGFELIVPMLLSEARTLKIINRQDESLLPEKTRGYHAMKLRAIARLGAVDRTVTMAHSAEMAGEDFGILLNVENLQEPNGSVGYSPSATAYFASRVVPADPAALDYLYQIGARGGCGVDVAPFDVFEPAWALWNFSLVNGYQSNGHWQFKPHLDFLDEAWLPQRGIGFTKGFHPVDSDNSSVAYEVLLKYGYDPDLDAILDFEEDTHFRCFAYESNPSISANIHVLGALRQANFAADSAVVHKVARFLSKQRVRGSYWLDKWHASPFYPTSHAVIIATGYLDGMVEKSIDWILEQQHADGSWGYYAPTAEETAYCLQALAIWNQRHNSIQPEVLQRGADWLQQNWQPPYEPLWVGKCLYNPQLVVYSAILSALKLVSLP